MVEKRVIPFDEFVKNHLESLRNKYPNSFRLERELRKGNRIKKSASLVYEIDDPEAIISMLGDYQNFPYTPIHNKLRPDEDVIMKMFDKYGVRANSDMVLPFSKAVEEQLGECCEKAILSHLFLQQFPFIEDKLLVSGSISDDSEALEHRYHAYNLAKRDGQWVIIDTSLPHGIGKDNKIIPYIVPVIGVNAERMFPLELDPQRRNGRLYHIRFF